MDELERVEFLQVLLNGLWHTTCPDRYQSILREGAILPEPPIADTDRWFSQNYPYVRKLGGVSLFDFNGFIPKEYGVKYPNSSWRYFVPYVAGRDTAIWIQIDRNKVSEDLLPGDELLAKWKQDEAHKHSLMPIIEAAHIGPLPVSAFQRVLLFDASDGSIKEPPIYPRYD